MHVCTFDEWITTNGTNRLDFVKIDVEGAEAKVVRGGIASLKKFSPIILFEWIPENAARFGNGNISEILDTFDELSYSVQRVKQDGNLTMDLNSQEKATNNYLAIHKSAAIDRLTCGKGGMAPKAPCALIEHRIKSKKKL